ncbi:tubulin-like doman-containing protein [Neobacillus sp. OS1-2]|uniref:tubulin-like doman-containing protein n=1 Tax=Neobacillus sp. OS1-2 TaxID=3070680 RepID=UPI0027E09915|nr:tubulin-like doman-containing protein [Neobacillus sp. OS1-2]WML41259.1 tubulin-like doman-containing protein [Neobacillus sp. OS1-2]
MKASVREHIQQLDVSLGGGIISEKIRVDTIDNPMLVIGLGGTGIDALLRLKYQVNRRFKLPQDPLSKKKKEKPNNIEFLAFETNEYDRNKKYKGIGLDPNKEFVLLSNPEIGGLLQNRSTIEPYIKEWLSPELLITDGISGASGVRQAGRLLLFTKINQVVQTIERKIEAVLEGTGKRLYVFILTGLSGGTGSGCYLDIAYITRGIMERKFGPTGVDKVSILGYLFTPDVNLSKRGLSSHTVEYIEKNGYAALKELDYWMNCDERNERFAMKYGSLLDVNSPMPPFNLCHLISGTNLEGKWLENAYDYCMNVTAENITNFMANEEKKSGEEFAIHDYISNIRTNIAQMPKPYAANYQYNIIGASMAEIPLEEMTTYIGYKLFEKMNTMFDAGPDQTEVEQFLEKLRIDPDSVHQRFNDRVPEPLSGFENSDRFSYNNVIKTSVINLDEELEREFLLKAKDQYRKCKKQLPGEIMEEFRRQMERLFLHPQKGPIFASRLIYSNDGFCMLKTLQAYIEGLRDRLERLPKAITTEQEYAYNKLEDARSAFISKDRKKNAYIEAKLNEYDARAEKARIEEMIEFYEDVTQLLNNQNNKIYVVYKEILETLRGIFEKNADILVDGEEVKQDNDVTYYWHLVSVPDVAREIQRMFDSKDGELLVQQWSEMLLEKSTYWVKETDIDVVGTVSEFLTDQFGELITKSMEDFLRLKYGDDLPIDKIIEDKIAARLDRDALPVFHLANSNGQLHFPQWGFVSVPVKAPNIFNGIKNFEKHSLSHSRFTIKESELKNRIFWLNTKNGIPLFAYSPLSIYEKSYEKTILEKEGVGRHLVQTAKENWAYLPSPIPEKSWGDTYQNERVKQYNSGVRALFNQAQGFGCITEKNNDQNTSARFQCHFTKDVNIGALFAAYEVDPKKLEKANLGNLKQVLRQLQDMFAGSMEVVGSNDIFGSTNVELAMENLIRSPKLIEKVKSEVRKYLFIQEKIAEIEQVLATQKDKEVLMSQFIQAFYTRTIKKRGALYVYDKELEEDAWEPFVNLTKTTKFVEYEIYQAFKSLNQKQMAQLEKKSERRSVELINQESAAQLIFALEEMAAAYQKEKETLDYDFKEFANGEELYAFYKEMMLKVQEMLRQLKS